MVEFPIREPVCSEITTFPIAEGRVEVRSSATAEHLIRLILSDASREMVRHQERELVREVGVSGFRVAVTPQDGGSVLAVVGWREGDVRATVHAHLTGPRIRRCVIFRYSFLQEPPTTRVCEESTVRAATLSGQSARLPGYRYNPFRFTTGWYWERQRSKALANLLMLAESTTDAVNEFGGPPPAGEKEVEAVPPG